MSIGRRVCLVAVPVAAVAALVLWAVLGDAEVPRTVDRAGRPVRIDPDYTGCTIPPNIAPLNFVVKEPGRDYRVRVNCDGDEGFVLSSGNGRIAMPLERWRALLDGHRGESVYFDVYVRGDDGRWRQYDRIANTIAREDVDPYLIYRRLRPLHNVFAEMGTYQRNVGSYDEAVVLESGRDSGRCVNCHTLVNNDPQTMCLHVRGQDVGAAMILAKDGVATKIDTRSESVSGAAAYTSWHPGGRQAAFSVNQLALLHHSLGNSRDVLDYGSDLYVYDVDSNAITSTPEISAPDRLETFPTWSPDGKYLYFCSAPLLWDKDIETQRALPEDFESVQYDLMRIPYDGASHTWGRLETVLSAADTGLSINEPRISPDGRFLLCCMTRYGSFPVYQRSSDLYMLDLASGRYWPLAVNSDLSESWHAWSSNGRWIVFASKRRDGLFGRVYYSYVGVDGHARKPVLLPQLDPAFYDSCLDNFNAPEMSTGPIGVTQAELLRAIRSDETKHAVAVESSPAGAEEEAGPTGPDAPLVDTFREPTPDVPSRTVVVDLDAGLRDLEFGQAAQQRGDVQRAAEYYARGGERLPQSYAARIPALQYAAWLYATHPSASVRNGEEALRLAEDAKDSAAWQIQSGTDQEARQMTLAFLPAVNDALAAAQAECGRFAQAAATALNAESMALRQGRLDLATQIRDRIDLYLVSRPYRTVTDDRRSTDD